MVAINEQAFLFLTCVKTGIIMGILYDLIRVFRKIIHHYNWVVQLEDLLYWITCGCFAFIMIYWRNYGQIRSFVFLGIIIGLTLYFCTVSILVMKITTQIINWAKKAINKFLHFIFIPIKCIILTIRIPINAISNKYKAINRFRALHKQKSKVKWRRRRAKLRTQLRIIKAKR
ncbi:MAG TPA: hypothetical protein GX707_20455 [Epulopiscium sp.]|nr:hypothetical protein [Candidatus Epulonipiscium sp.]